MDVHEYAVININNLLCFRPVLFPYPFYMVPSRSCKSRPSPRILWSRKNVSRPIKVKLLFSWIDYDRKSHTHDSVDRWHTRTVVFVLKLVRFASTMIYLRRVLFCHFVSDAKLVNTGWFFSVTSSLRSLKNLNTYKW